MKEYIGEIVVITEGRACIQINTNKPVYITKKISPDFDVILGDKVIIAIDIDEDFLKIKKYIPEPFSKEELELLEQI